MTKLVDIVELVSDYTFRTVLIGAMGIGAISGTMGCFAYLRRQSLVGDVVSHSSLLGIMLFFLISYQLTGEGSKSLFVLIPGAVLSGVAALLLTQWIVSNARVRSDSALGTMLAIFFGTGILLLRWVQQSDTAIPGRRGLKDYLFGMAASMTESDLTMVGIVGLFSFVVVVLLWCQLKVFTFDPVFSHCIGLRGRFLDVVLIVLMVNGIVIGIQCVGVVLMIALLVAPAAAARQWTSTLGRMVILAAVIGAICGGIGATTSALASHVPTGPVIVLAGFAFFAGSILFAPSRGAISRWSKRRQLIRALKSSGESGDLPC